MNRYQRVRFRALQTRRPVLRQLADDVVAGVDFLASTRNSREARTSFSQFGEDKALRSLLPERYGSYLDIGAGHPIRNSNSYFFYRMGWAGTLIEPIAGLAALCRKTRPRDVVLQSVVGTQSPDLHGTRFWEFSPTEYSTADPVRAQRLIAEGFELKSEYVLQTTHIEDVVGEVLPTDPFFMSLDVEGMDFLVLSSIPWSTFRPRVLCVEDPLALNMTSNISDLLRDQGYELVSQHLVSSIYRHVESC